MAKKKKTTSVEPIGMVHPRALVDYLNRVGAETLSFRRAMVKERSKGDSYYIERTLIKIESDGAIVCSRNEHKPTKEEAEAIKVGFVGLDFPRSIGASKAGYATWLQSQTGDKGRFFEFWDRRNGNIVMVQERVIKADGSKIFVPWCLWSDGVWRSMEPDGLLPFWKPETKVRGRIMIHEGAKAAKFVTELCLDKKRLEAHPWGEVLELYEHWGLIGGALAPHRADYSEVTRERPMEVIYVCDNDYPGEAALQEVSRWYGAALKGIKFDKRWKMSWDLADDMPEGLFARGGRYIGPRLMDLVEPATRATELVPPPEGTKGRSTVALKRAFKEEWVHSITPEVFIHRDFPNRIYTAQEFNNKVAPFSDVDDTARLIKKDAASKSAVLKYDPGKVSGIFGSGDSGRYINTHVASVVKTEKGNAGPFLDFMARLVPVEKDRLELMRWCATLIAQPEVKMLYGVLLISEMQGIGKGTLGEKILAPLVGEPNVSYPSEEEIVNSNFNYWLAHKRLAVVHEIYAGHSSKAYNRLKSVITDRYITVSKKFQANYEIENWMHVFACSNSMRAIQLSSDDRRWFVPKVTEEKSSPEYWAKFNKWLSDDGGLGIIKWWAEDFLKKESGVLRGESAPSSKAKEEVIEEGYSPGMALVARAFDKVSEQLKLTAKDRAHGVNGNQYRLSVVDEKVMILDTDLVELIRQKIHDGRTSDRLERPMTLRKIAKQKGWFISEARVSTVKDWNCHSCGARMLFQDRRLAEKPVSELVNAGVKPLNLDDLIGF